MHPQMSQSYLQNDGFGGLFAPPNLHNPGMPHANGHGMSFNGYDSNSYANDPYAGQFDMSKHLHHQLQYLPPPQPQYQHTSQTTPSPTQNNFVMSSPYLQQTGYPTPDPSLKRRHHAPNTSISSEDSNLPTPSLPSRNGRLRAPKFDRTYTDAIEDELYDDTGNGNNGSLDPQSRNPRSAAPNCFATPGYPSVGQYPTQMAPTISRQQQQQQIHAMNNAQKPTSANMVFSQSSPPMSYDPLGSRDDPQRLSSSAVAENVRRLQPPNRTTVSPREAFLDYPDNADFSERSLFNKSVSPYSQPNHNGSESSGSNDEEYNARENGISYSSMPTYPMHQTQLQPPAPTTSSRSASTSTHHSGLPSGDMSVESTNSSDSEYDPQAQSRRASRSSGRSGSITKPFPCPECGKRFDKSLPLQNHRRNMHGKSSGPPSLSQNKYSNTSHRCDYVDPTTGKMCNTAFSRP